MSPGRSRPRTTAPAAVSPPSAPRGRVRWVSPAAASTTQLRDVYPSDRAWSVPLRPQLLLQFLQQPLSPLRFDVLQAHPIDARCTPIRLYQGVGVRQHVVTMDLVVQRVRSEVGSFLARWYSASCSSRSLVGVVSVATISPPSLQWSHRRAGPRPSGGFHRFPRYHGPVRLLVRPVDLGLRLVPRLRSPSAPNEVSRVQLLPLTSCRPCYPG